MYGALCNAEVALNKANVKLFPIKDSNFCLAYLHDNQTSTVSDKISVASMKEHHDLLDDPKL